MYEVKETIFGAHKKISVFSESVKFEFCLTGATPLSLSFNKNGEFVSVLDGYSSPEEFDTGNGSRNWIMTPFANRIENDCYSFLGNQHSLKPIAPKTRVIHGFTSMKLFEVENIFNSNDSIRIQLKNSSIRKAEFDGYPFDVDVFIYFTLTSDQLLIEVKGKNLSDFPIPFWSGWHPYFKTSDNGIEDLKLTLNASSIILMDEIFIPLKGNEAYADISLFPEFDLRRVTHGDGNPINKKIFDLCYADLMAETDGNFSTYIVDEKSQIKLKVFQNKGVTLIFSGDSLIDRKRKSIAIEPMQCLTNSFNRKEFEDEITINPGEEKSFKFGVKFILEG